MRLFLAAAVTLMLLNPGGTAVVVAAGNDWSHWRGPEQNGVSRERDLPETFSLDPKAAGSNLVFAVPHGSITTPIVQDGQVYIINKSGEGETQQERVQAFDAGTGKLLWEHKLNVFHTDIVEDRLGFTNLCGDKETGYVYAHTTSGLFLCYDKKGKLVWKRSLTEEYGRVSGYGGRLATPIVDEDKVIVSFLNSAWGELTIGQTRMVAFDKKTGKVIWWASGNHRVKDTYYSNPVVAVIKGQRLILTGGGDGCLHAFKARTGERVWSYKLEDGGGAINCSPVVQDNLVWVGHGEENIGNGTQGRIVCLDAGDVTKMTPKLVWQHDGVKVKFASPILYNGLLYVCDDAGRLYCFDAKKGGDEPLWRFKYGRATKGSPVLADGKIYISEVDSAFHILKDNGQKAPKRIHRVEFPPVGIVPTELHGSPAVADGKVYFTSTTHLVCIGKKGHKTPADKIPEPVKEPAGKPGKLAFLQVVPADATLAPGGDVELRVYGYDDQGRSLGEVKAKWEKARMLGPVYPIGLTPPKPTGKPTPPPVLAGDLLSDSGTYTKFTAAKAPNGQFGRVVAKVDGVEGYARIRVAPVLPYEANLKNLPLGSIPPGWVNTMAKFAVAKGPDGTQVLRKRNDQPSPLVARANAYITDTQLSDYTIEADISATKVRDKDMADVGVGACRYVLYLIGNDQEARLVTWDAQKRIEKKVSFPWKPGVWYRLKLMATVADGKGVVKGKVWPRDQKEPEKWTLQIEDPVPNKNGAALLYGFANGTISAADPGATAYYENIKITPNKTSRTK